MLKRMQILLSDWLVDFVKFESQKYDVSFSEVVRLMLCMQLEHLITVQYPKHKFKVSLKEATQKLKAAEKDNSFETVHHELISKIYFEGRKAAEYILNQEQNPPK